MLTKTKRFRGPFNLWMQSTSVFAIATYLSAFVLVAPGCGDDDAAAIYAFDTSACAQGLSGETEASAAVREATSIRSYSWKVSADGVDVDIKGDGSSLGKLHMELDAEDGQPVGRTELRVGGKVVAAQKLTTRWMNGGRLAVRADNTVGEEASRTWITLDADFAVERLTVGAPATSSPPYPAEVQVGLDGAWKTFDAVVYGNPLGEAVIKQWVAENLSTFKDNPTWTLLVEAANDPAWLLQAEGQARMCNGGAAEQAEGVLRQGLSSTCSQRAALSAASDITGQRYAQSSCKKDDPISTYQRIERVLGVVGLAIGFVGALLLGAKIGIAFAIGAAGFFLFEKVIAPAVIERYVKERREVVVKRLGQSGNWLISGSGDREEAFESFFGGGGGGGGGGTCSPFLSSGDSCGVTDAGKKAGKSTGDPHLDTFDGKKYDLQAAGELVLVRSRTDSNFEIQTRQSPFSGICSNVSGNKAVAARVGADRVAFYVDKQRPLHVDGKAVDVPGGVLVLPGGGAVRQLDKKRYVVSWPTGDAMLANVAGAHISVWVGLARSRRGQVEGLLGNHDGDPTNDIARADGTVLEQPVSWDVIAGDFANDWRVTAESSLFDYDSGESPSTFVIEGFPSSPAKIDSLPADALSEAEAACARVENPIVKEDCILDVACTGDESFVDATEGRDPKSAVTLEQPVFLTDWTQEGIISNNKWIVSEDGRSVTQTNNGSPTFFVSPDNHFNEVIRGRFLSTGGDDDIMGFVFGYNGPFTAEDDPVDAFSTWLLSWKGRDQGAALAGLTLARLDGVVDDSGSGNFWSQTSGPTYEVVGQSLSPNLGWRKGKEYDFELVYTTDRLIIRINGATFFDLTAAEAGVTQFETGRFGFYNFSQPDVTYSNFSAAPATAEPPLTPVPVAGLRHRLDAATGVMVVGDAVQSWSSGAATLTVPTPEQRPTLIRDAINGAPAIRFDGVDDLLQSVGNGTTVDAMTVLAVVAPRANAGDFAAIISGTELDRNDYNKGFAIDLGGKTAGNCATSYPDPLDAFNTINVVTGLWGYACGEDYMSTSLPFGEFHLLTVEAGHELMTVRVDGQQVGEEDHGARNFTISLDELRVGARHFSNVTQGFFDGDIAEILVYDRPLSLLERDALEAELLKKYGL